MRLVRHSRLLVYWIRGELGLHMDRFVAHPPDKRHSGLAQSTRQLVLNYSLLEVARTSEVPKDCQQNVGYRPIKRGVCLYKIDPPIILEDVGLSSSVRTTLSEHPYTYHDPIYHIITTM